MSQSLKRGLQILDLFSQDRPITTLEEVASEVGTSTITAYRYVKVLCDAGMLVMNDGKIQLSAKILRFGNLFWEEDRLIAIAKKHIVHLNKEFNETMALCQIEGNDVISTYKMDSSLSLRSSFSIGQRMSIHAGAYARSIAAFLPAKEQKAIIDSIKWKPYTENTIISRAEYEQRLSEIRKRGYDISVEEVVLGVIAIAAPIKFGERAVGSLGLSMPSVRKNSANMPVYIKKLQEAAQSISEELQKDPFFIV